MTWPPTSATLEIVPVCPTHVETVKRPSSNLAVNQTSEVIRRLLDAHFGGDDVGFRDAAWDLVRRERSLKHNILADELERILAAANAQDSKAKSFLRALSPSNGNLPKDKDRNANLIELSDPAREIGDLVLAPDLCARLDRVVVERRGADLLHSHGMRPVSKLLFCGPPGCGKTVAAEAMAKELYLPLATVRFDAVVSSYLGETAANLRKVFEFARLRPMLLFFDEFDAIGKHRTAFDEHGELKRVVNSFLQLLDGFHSETLTVAATNHQGLLDAALWRRFDDILFFPKPTAEQIESLLFRLFRQVTLSKSVRIRAIADSLEGLSHADVERIAQDAIKQSLLSDRREIRPDELDAAIARQMERVRVTNLSQDQSDAEIARAPRRSRKTR